MIYCKDCKYWVCVVDQAGQITTACLHKDWQGNGRIVHHPPAEDFCSKAERYEERNAGLSIG